MLGAINCESKASKFQCFYSLFRPQTLSDAQTRTPLVELRLDSRKGSALTSNQLVDTACLVQTAILVLGKEAF